MKKIIILLCIPLLFGSCEKILPSGTVKLEATCQTVPFEVNYDNEYGNDVTETIYTTSWSKEFEGSEFDYVTLRLRNISNNSSMNCSFSIKWKGSVQTSYEGEVFSSERISATL